MSHFEQPIGLKKKEEQKLKSIYAGISTADTTGPPGWACLWVALHWLVSHHTTTSPSVNLYEDVSPFFFL